MRLESDPVFLAVNPKDNTLIQELDPGVECFIGVLLLNLSIVLLLVIIRSCIHLQIKETQRLKDTRF